VPVARSGEGEICNPPRVLHPPEHLGVDAH
jgi:hypothetical protein